MEFDAGACPLRTGQQGDRRQTGRMGRPLHHNGALPTSSPPESCASLWVYGLDIVIAARIMLPHEHGASLAKNIQHVERPS